MYTHINSVWAYRRSVRKANHNRDSLLSYPNLILTLITGSQQELVGNQVRVVLRLEPQLFGHIAQGWPTPSRQHWKVHWNRFNHSLVTSPPISDQRRFPSYLLLYLLSSFTFPGAPYRIFLLCLPWLPSHFYLIEQQQCILLQRYRVFTRVTGQEMLLTPIFRQNHAVTKIIPANNVSFYSAIAYSQG